MVKIMFTNGLGEEAKMKELEPNTSVSHMSLYHCLSDRVSLLCFLKVDDKLAFAPSVTP